MPVPVSKPRRDPAVTRRQWAERLDRFRRSGQTVAQFCDAEGVSAPSFYVWKRTLAAESAATPTPALVPIHVTPSPTPAVIELSLPSGAVLRLPADIRVNLLVAVLRGLEGRPC
ncbi:Uncharacterized protein OS=Rhodopirellula europaea 6C GN=RE6C_02662 PE=4 SV=1 [Gemmataceae bacterium]|nr:Uncharacterized protein OS=Rhodopirellula europaea 6C GN=RE6C_02662 PE=4 SV=1 [Gemmataceae bacterium]VTT98823.1 Uncharacterized protein OS=Rhodopirellula europaea 6C GN=RE6C_02662 PE=4 SV=1 [Gemmataceae bacterium]